MLSSKFTFTLIAIAALFVGGSGLVAHDAFAVIEAPEFTAIHLNTTATHITFDKEVNGTLAILDWTLKTASTAVAGSSTTDIEITNVANSTNTGIGLTIPSDADKVTSSTTGVVGLGFINGTDIVLIHSAINSGSTYFVNYTNNAASLEDKINQYGQIMSLESAGIGCCGHTIETPGVKFLKIGSNATAVDWMVPTAVSAEKTGPKKIAVLMSEPVGNINSTGIDFTLSGTIDSVVGSLIASNGTNTIYLTTRNLIDPINDTPTITLSYNPGLASAGVGVEQWILMQ